VYHKNIGLSNNFGAISKPMYQWGQFFGAELVAPLGNFNSPSGTVLISTFIPKTCHKCEDAMPLSICNACGKNPNNSVKVNAGLGSGNYQLWGFGDSENSPEYPHFFHIPFDKCLEPDNKNFGKNFAETSAIPVIVAKFDADSFYRNYPTVFVGDKSIALDGLNFVSSSKVALGMTREGVRPDQEANIYVIAWIGYLHDPSTHFFMDKDNIAEGYSMPESYGKSDGELGVIACSVVPEELLVDFMPIYNANESRISDYRNLATGVREFALLNGAYIGGPEVTMLISNSGVTDSRKELADYNEKTWMNHGQHFWFIGTSWRRQLESLEFGSAYVKITFQVAQQAGGPSDAIAVADSLRLRGQVTACQAILDRVESDYKGSLTEQNQMMIKAMKLTPAGHMIGSWSLK
jgi:hypothetical protein